jgi:hypothetical protein
MKGGIYTRIAHAGQDGLKNSGMIPGTALGKLRSNSLKFY